MGHQPFETWLLSEEPLLPEDEQKLQDHLENCDDCQHLSVAWGEVDAMFLGATSEGPAPGFTMRWQTRLVNLENAEYQRKQKRTSWMFFALTAGAALLVLAYLAIQFFSSIQAPVQLFISGLTLWAGILTVASAVQVAFIPFLDVLLVSVPIYWWIILAMAVSMLVVMFGFSIRYILIPRRVSL
jgi:predicted anti-sigma-YlaC factor YlaD